MTESAAGLDDLSQGASRIPPWAGVGFLISQLGYLISARFRAILAPLGLEPRHFLVLRHLGSAEGCSQQALGQALHIPASRMVGLVDTLEQRGLLERRANPRDRRARALHITDQGRRVFEHAWRQAAEHELAICAGLSTAEREQLLALLRRLPLARELIPGVHPALADGCES